MQDGKIGELTRQGLDREVAHRLLASVLRG
jgi:hypothetical protein